jgi:hypothetical protein
MCARFLGAIAFVAARVSYIWCWSGDDRGAVEHTACHAGKVLFHGDLRILEGDSMPRM